MSPLREARPWRIETGTLSVLVNNSGIGGPSGLLWEMALMIGTRHFRSMGCVLATKAIMLAMMDRVGGSVIAIGSISGKRRLWGRSPYTTSKMALVGLVRMLALGSRRSRSAGPTEAEDIARTCDYPAWVDADAITGADVNVNFGVMMY